VFALALAAACHVPLSTPPPRQAEEFTEGRELVDLAELAALRERAEAAPDDLDAQWSAAIAHVSASLQGHVELRDTTERLLHRTWLLDPHGERVPAARVLARYLNMRSSVLDLEAIDLQVALYDALCESNAQAQGASAMPAEQFEFASMGLAAQALAEYREGRELAALARVRQLERRMDRRLRAHADEIDTHTMAGNFELTFAAALPIGREARLERAIDHLSAQQDRWAQLSPRARNTRAAPNVRSVFGLWLAEALLAAGQSERAAEAYRRVLELRDQADTNPRRQIVTLAEHRLANLDRYVGDDELLPAWPAGVSSCVACHSQEATLPTDDLHWVDTP
jgi:tetratricopeptide (TPR) repeat protein